jgi:hypothetical protein
MSTSHFNNARKWFQAAHLAAEARQDHAKQMTTLDLLAINAGERGDDQALMDALSAMCRVLESAPRMDSLILMIAEWATENDKGSVVLPFLECLIRHQLQKGYPRSQLYLSLSAYVEVQRQEGRTDDEISGMLDAFQPYAVGGETSRDLAIAHDRAFKQGRQRYDMR